MRIAFGRIATPLVPRDLVAVGLWVLAVVPPAMGFWLVAGSLAHIAPNQVHELVVASLLGLGVATALQVALGFRLPMYEGPSSAYLAAITVVAAQGHSAGLRGVAGGLIAAGIFVAVLALLNVDLLMLRLFTPLVANLFVLVVTLAVLPATIERAIGATDGLPGQGAAWAGTLTVVAVTVALRRVRTLSPYSLAIALLAGTAVHLAIAGVPHVRLGGGLAAPALLPWGAPAFSGTVVVPFVVAGALAAFNTLASGDVAIRTLELPRDPRATRRALFAHGAALAGGSLFGNVVGNVSRLDSMGIVRLIGHRGRRPLVLAAVVVAVLAFVQPVVALAAALPLSVSAALLGVILMAILVQAVGFVARQPRRVIALVAVPALLPTAGWIAIGNSLPPTAQLVGNPMLWGVALAAILQRVVNVPGGSDGTVRASSAETPSQ